jgi:hypothetical protein
VGITLVSFYLIVAMIQVVILHLICYNLVHFIWRLKKNPDHVSIPFLTAIGDLLGTSLLFLAFHVAYLNGNTSIGTVTTTAFVTNTTMTTSYYNSTTPLW